MEILFIWLYDYKNLKEQGFNFSSEYIFNVKKEGDIAYKVNISKNKDFIPGFFEKDNILNVTAIIGQNGSGKSNILDFIKTSFPEGYPSIQSQAIIAYRLNEGIEKKIILIPNNSFKVEVTHQDDFEVFNYPSNMPTEASGLNGLDYSKADYVFYSNIFDLRSEEISMAGMYNLSTLGLLKSDTGDLDEQQLATSGGSYDSFRANEIRRNIQFLLSDYTHLLQDVPLPEYLFIEILSNDLDYFQNQKNKNTDIQYLIDFFQKQILPFEITSIEWLLHHIYISVFLNFLKTDREFSLMPGFITQVSFNQADTIKSYVFNFFNHLETTAAVPQQYKKKSKIAIDFFHYIEALFEKESFKAEKNETRSIIKYSLNKESLEEITKFLRLYINLKGLTDFLDFNWRNLSSGEQSLFTFISRFYHLKHHQIQHEDLKKNIVILIDEGDIYFHPAWQKKFFQITIDYLSELLEDHNLQFIFTANTPFLTSDLPKSNVIFIEKKENGTVHVHGTENDRLETFGGNIHTLFADSFYMKGALIGEFAKEKINKIINYLSTKNEEKKDDYKKTIDIIGEPVLKRKLQQMWFEKFGVDEEIAELERRIEELSNKTKLF